MVSLKAPSKVEPIDLPFVPPIVFNQPSEKMLLKQESISSIEKTQSSSSSTFIPSKPILESPKEKNPDFKNNSTTMGTLEKIIALENLEKKLEGLRSRGIEGQFHDLEKIIQDESAAMKEALSHQRNVGFWSVLEDISNVFTSAVSSVLGFSMISSGSTVLGATLISSGILAITNIAFKQAGVWDWVATKCYPEDEYMKNQVLFALPAALGIITTVLGISGSIGAYYYKQLGDFERLLTILQTASSLVSGTTAIGNGVAISNAKSSSAKLSFLQSMSGLSKIDLQNALQNMTTFFDNQVQSKELAKEIMEAKVTQTQIITQQAV